MGGQQDPLSDTQSDKPTPIESGFISYKDLDTCKFLEDECPFYMSMGMSYDEYWHGPADLPKYYRKAYDLKMHTDNREMFMLGRYVYDAICATSPILRAFSKATQPEPYLKEPYPLTEKEAQERLDREEEEKQRKAMAQRIAQFNEWNANFNKKGDEVSAGIPD